MEVSDFMDRIRKLPVWKQNYIFLSALSHIDAERKHDYQFAHRTWNELVNDLIKMEKFKLEDETNG